MALTTTTLAAAADAATLRFNVTAATGATVGGFMRVDGEFMVITAISGTAIDVRSRGDQGGIAVAHDILAPVTFFLATDQAALGVTDDRPVPAKDFDLLNVGQNGVIAVPKRPTTYVLNKASALASTTLANPAADQNGLVLRFLTATDAAHVITTDHGHDGTTGEHTTCTSAAYIGACLSLIAVDGKWLVLSNNNWTIT